MPWEWYMQIEWWHWMVAGVGLVLLELAVPAFFVIWFGLGAFVVGVSVAVVPSLGVAAQVGLWIVASIAFVVAWFKVFRAQGHRTLVGMSEGQFAGEVGIATRPLKPFQKGSVRFQKPILGSDVWEAISNEEVAVGDRVEVLSVEGNLLRIAKSR